MLFIDTTVPNLYSALIVLFQTFGTAFGLWLTYRATINRVATKDEVQEVRNTVATKDQLAGVHDAVNGNLSRVTERAEKAERLLRKHGIDLDTP
jgi:hypothetical protein